MEVNHLEILHKNSRKILQPNLIKEISDSFLHLTWSILLRQPLSKRK
ncbi:UNVERIFIED_CONTAM: hypothetical protein GTU68_037190 [Idotea baltica]|nr:hypothetical protein [Idotea baltica]